MIRILFIQKSGGTKTVETRKYYNVCLKFFALQSKIEHFYIT